MEMQGMEIVAVVERGEKRKSTGRKKIEIKKLTSKEKRQVTFSKRRHGLINKASELCILCGSEIAILTSSPVGNRVFSFGYPSADIVVDRYIESAWPSSCMAPPITTTTTSVVAATAAAEESARKYMEAVKCCERERKRESSSKDCSPLWEMEIENMEMDELESYMEALTSMGSQVKMMLSFMSVLHENKQEGEEEDLMSLVDSFLLPPSFPQSSLLELEGAAAGGTPPHNLFFEEEKEEEEDPMSLVDSFLLPAPHSSLLELEGGAAGGTPPHNLFFEEVFPQDLI